MGAVKALVLAAEEGDAHAAHALRRLSATETLARFAESFGLDAGHYQVGEEDCSTCQGEGYVESLVYGRGAGPEGLEPIYEVDECPSCCGTGKAPVVAFAVRPWEPLADAPRREPADFNLAESGLPF